MPLQALKAYALGKELAFKMRAVRADRMFVSRIKSWIMSSVLLLLPGVAWASPPGLEHEPTTQSQERVERFERPLDFEAPLTLDLGLRVTRRAPALPDLRDDLRLPPPGCDGMCLSVTVERAWTFYVTADLDAELPRIDAVDGETYFTVGASLQVTPALSVFVEDFQPASMVIGGADEEEPAPHFSWDGHQVSVGARLEVGRVRLQAAGVIYALSITDRQSGIGAIGSVTVAF